MPLEFKTKLTPAQYNRLKGSIDEHQYVWDPEEKMFVKTMRTIKGIAEIKKKSPRYALATKIGNTGMVYLAEDFSFTEDKKKAKEFFTGFDLPEVQIKKYKAITGVNLYQVGL